MPERYFAVDNVCAWPNLTLLPDGSIAAAIFNQPCHGVWEGDIDCWASADGGATWRLRGTPSAHEPGTNRHNVAAGRANNGDLIVLAMGWTDRPPVGQQATSEGGPLPVRICRSADGGKTWSHREPFAAAVEPGMSQLIPFGDILPCADGSLGVSAYAGRAGGPGEWSKKFFEHTSSYFYRSRDDGQTWGEGAIIAPGDYNETAPVHLGGGRWLAVARTSGSAASHQFVSDDDGRSWRFDQVVGLAWHHPAHLLRLADGRVLLALGNRTRGHYGVDVRLSSDQGRTWTPPARLVALDEADLGYPSTVQRADGRLVTAYYASRASYHNRYHMAVVIWEVEEIFTRP